MKNISDVNKILSETQDKVLNFIKFYNLIKSISDLFFDDEDNFDPIKELNRNIDSIYLNPEENFENDINKNDRFSNIFYFKKNIPLQRKENIVNLSSLNAEKLLKIQIEDDYQNIINFVEIKKEQLNKDDNMKNYKYLKEVLKKNIFFMEKFLHKLIKDFSESLIKYISFSDIKNIFESFIENFVKIIEEFFSIVKIPSSLFLTRYNPIHKLKEDTLEKLLSQNKEVYGISIGNYQNNEKRDHSQINKKINYNQEMSKIVFSIKTLKILFDIIKKGFNKLNTIFEQSKDFSIKIKDSENSYISLMLFFKLIHSNYIFLLVPKIAI